MDNAATSGQKASGQGALESAGWGESNGVGFEESASLYGTGLFLYNESTIELAIDLLALGAKGGFKRLVAKRVIVEGQIELRDSGIAVQPRVLIDWRSVEDCCLLLARRLV